MANSLFIFFPNIAPVVTQTPDSAISGSCPVGPDCWCPTMAPSPEGQGEGLQGCRTLPYAFCHGQQACEVWRLCSLADVMEPEEDPEPSAGRQLRVRCGQLLACGQWHHLAVVVTKEMKRNCTVSTYLDGQIIGSAKVS